VILLLDTHVVLWWLEDPSLVSEAARDAISDPVNDVLVSAVSSWEIAIKAGVGKLDAPPNFEEAVAQCGLKMISITCQHALQTQSLPLLHRDPFDRLLVAQAIVEGATLVTRDAMIRQYGVPAILA
jgi:PIN domain nuclease of toxin-antitoxin system